MCCDINNYQNKIGCYIFHGTLISFLEGTPGVHKFPLSKTKPNGQYCNGTLYFEAGNGIDDGRATRRDSFSLVS